MKPSIVVDKYAKLPEGCELWAYSPDTLVLVGPRMDRESYNKIRAMLPARLGANLIGWRRIARAAAR